MSLLAELRNTTFPYSPSIVDSVIQHNKDTYGYVKPITKKIIFFMMKRVILRGVSTFFNINRNRNNEVYYDEEDLVMELYFVLDNCVDKFDTKLNKDFYLYFNSSVSRRVARMANYKKVNNGEITFTKYELQITKGDSELCLDDVLEGAMQVEMSNNDFEEYLDSIKWAEDEKGVLESIKMGRGMRDIMNENKLSKEGYLSMMERIRNRITNEMAQEDLFRKVVNIMR